MPLDPQAKVFLDLVNVTRKQPFHELGAEQARLVYAERPAYLAPEFVELAKVENRNLEHQDRHIPCRIYTPTISKQPLPAIVFYHGGGMVIGTLDSYDTLCRQIAYQSGLIVISVDYRLAPENKFPCAVEDAYGALCWLVENGQSTNVDVSNIVLAGDSAGGNLAAVCAILARDNKLLDLRGQVLIYPATAPCADSGSHLDCAKGYFLERETVLWFHDCYLRTDDDRQDFRYAPLIAKDLSGLPPALVIVAQYDTLRDEGIAYAKALESAGVNVHLHEYQGMFHPFVSLAGVLDQGQRAITEIATTAKSFCIK